MIDKKSCKKINGIWKKTGCLLPVSRYPKVCPVHGDNPQLGDFEHITVDHDSSNKGRKTDYIHCARLSEDFIIIDADSKKVLYIDSIMLGNVK
jgi:hypothetical protein